MGEADRLRFLVDRDGEDAACEWAGETLRVYRRTVLHNPATLYRRRLVESYLAFKRFRTGLARGEPVTDVLDRIGASVSG